LIYRATPVVPQPERRRAVRYHFGGIAEVTDLVSQKTLVELTRDLSSCGCFVKTKTPFPKGTPVNVRIMHSGTTIAALGNVSDNVSHEGMGIAFVRIEPRDQTVLEQWLSHASAK
jgi:hypothetical protein